MAETDQTRPSLRSTTLLLTITGMVLAIGQVLQFINIDNPWYTGLIDVLALMTFCLPFVYRTNRSQQQSRLNHWAQSGALDTDFVLSSCRRCARPNGGLARAAVVSSWATTAISGWGQRRSVGRQPHPQSGWMHLRHESHWNGNVSLFLGRS